MVYSHLPQNRKGSAKKMAALYKDKQCSLGLKTYFWDDNSQESNAFRSISVFSNTYQTKYGWMGLCFKQNSFLDNLA